MKTLNEEEAIDILGYHSDRSWADFVKILYSSGYVIKKRKQEFKKFIKAVDNTRSWEPSE